MQDSWVFTLARNYFDLTGTVGNYKYVGTLFIDVDLERMEAAFKNLNLNARDQVYVCDRENNCYYSSDESLIGKNPVSYTHLSSASSEPLFHAPGDSGGSRESACGPLRCGWRGGGRRDGPRTTRRSAFPRDRHGPLSEGDSPRDGVW